MKKIKIDFSILKMNIFAFTILVLIVLSLAQYIDGSRYSFVTGNSGAFSQIVYGAKISQEVTIDDAYRWNAESWGAEVISYSMNPVGKVVFTLEQNGKLIDTDAIPVKNIGNSGECVYPALKFNKLKSGAATISIELSDECEEVYVMLTPTFQNMKDCIGPMVPESGLMMSQAYSLIYKDVENSLSYVVAFVLAIFLGLGLKLAIVASENKVADNKKNGLVLFCLSIGIFVCMQYLRNTALFFNPCYAEAPLNYLGNALNRGVHAFGVSDANYLPLFQRIISVLIVRILHIPAYASLVILQLLAFVISGAFYSLLMLEPFKNRLSPVARFVVTVTVMFGSYYFETVTFINFIIYGAFLLLFYISDTDIWSKTGFVIITVMAGFTCMSKGSFVVMLPASAALLILYGMRMNLRERIFSGVLALSSVVQLVCSMKLGAMEKWGNSVTRDMGDYFKLGYCTLQDYVNTVFMSAGSLVTLLNPVAILLVILAVAFLMYLLLQMILDYKNKTENDDNKRLMMISVMILGFCAFFRLSLSRMDERFRVDGSYHLITKAMNTYNDFARASRHTAILYALSVAFVVSVLAMVAKYLGEKKSTTFALIWCSVILLGCGSLNLNGLLSVHEHAMRESRFDGSCELSLMKHLQPGQPVVIPVLPTGWSYATGPVEVVSLGENRYSWQEEMTPQSNYGILTFSSLPENYVASGVAEISAVDLKSGIQEVIIAKNNKLITSVYSLKVLDGAGNEIATVSQNNDPRSTLTTFYFDTPIAGASKLVVVDANGQQMNIENCMYVVIVNN